MKKFNSILLGLLLTLSIFGQTDIKKNSGLFGSIEYRRISSFAYNSQLISKSDFLNRIGSNGLRTTIGYFIHPKFSIGASFGLENFDAEGNTAPLSLDLKGYLKDSRNTPFAYLNAGSLLKLSNTFERGGMFETGVGYKFFISRKLCLTSSLGYNLRRFPDSKALLLVFDDNGSFVGSNLVNNPTTYHSVAFTIGILF